MENSGISYDDTRFSNPLPQYVPTATPPNFASRLVQNGIARDIKQANMFMLAGVLGLMVVAAGLTYFSLNDSRARINLERMKKDAKIDQTQYANTR